MKQSNEERGFSYKKTKALSRVFYVTASSCSFLVTILKQTLISMLVNRTPIDELSNEATLCQDTICRANRSVSNDSWKARGDLKIFARYGLQGVPNGEQQQATKDYSDQVITSGVNRWIWFGPESLSEPFDERKNAW